MSFVIESGWEGEVFSGIKRYAATLKDITKHKIGWESITTLLETYVAAAEKAMGSVTARRGGYPSIDFNGATPEFWKPLSIYTVYAKNHSNVPQQIAQEVLKASWDKYADSTPIWEYTGVAKNGGLEINNDGTVSGLDYMQLVDEGGTGSWGKEVPARPLFAVINEGFLNYIKSELRNKRSELYKTLRREVKKAGLWE